MAKRAKATEKKKEAIDSPQFPEHIFDPIDKMFHKVKKVKIWYFDGKVEVLTYPKEGK